MHSLKSWTKRKRSTLLRYHVLARLDVIDSEDTPIRAPCTRRSPHAALDAHKLRWLELVQLDASVTMAQGQPMDPLLHTRALERLRAGCAASRESVSFAGGAALVYEMGHPSRLSFVLHADRDRVTKADAENAARALALAVTHAEPALEDRLRWSVVPRSASADLLTPAARALADAASERLGELLTAHEAACDEHRDSPGYLFITEVEPRIGWHVDEDHLLAWFCVDSSCTSAADDACCAKAVAAVKMEMRALERLRWQCTPYR